MVLLVIVENVAPDEPPSEKNHRQVSENHHLDAFLAEYLDVVDLKHDHETVDEVGTYATSEEGACREETRLGLVEDDKYHSHYHKQDAKHDLSVQVVHLLLKPDFLKPCFIKIE